MTPRRGLATLHGQLGLGSVVSRLVYTANHVRRPGGAGTQRRAVCVAGVRAAQQQRGCGCARLHAAPSCRRNCPGRSSSLTDCKMDRALVSTSTSVPRYPSRERTESLVVRLRLLLRVLAVRHALQLRLRHGAAEEAGRDRARRSLDVSVLQGRARRERVSSCPALGSFTPNEPLLGALALLLGLACFCHAAL